MRRIRRILCVALLMNWLLVFPFTATAASTVDGYTYEVNQEDSNTITVTGYSGTQTSLNIPQTIDGKTVTAIGERAFAYQRSITEVTIPDSVVSVGAWSFWDAVH